MTEIEKRKNFLINTTYIIFLCGLYYLFMKYAFWTVFPFLFSVFIAMVMQKPINFLTNKTKLNKTAASVSCVLILFLIIAGIISLIGVKIFTEIRGLISSLILYSKDWPTFLVKAQATLLNSIRFMPDSIERPVGTAIKDLFAKLSSNTGSSFNISSLSAPISGVWSTAKAVPQVIVAIIIAIVACFFMTTDYDRIIAFIKRQMPENKKEALSITKRTSVSSIGKLARAYAILMLLTFSEMALGLNIFRWTGLYEANFLIATAIIVAVVDIVPILGTGTVLIPWAIYSLLSGSTGFGIGLLVLYVLMYIIRQAVEPKLVAANLDLPPILTLMGMYIGVKLFGFIGLFLVPLSIMIVKILNDEGIVKLWKNLSKPYPKTEDTHDKDTPAEHPEEKKEIDTPDTKPGKNADNS